MNEEIITQIQPDESLSHESECREPSTEPHHLSKSISEIIAELLTRKDVLDQLSQTVLKYKDSWI